MKRLLVCFFVCLLVSPVFALVAGGVGKVNYADNKAGRVLIPDVALSFVLDEDAVYKNGCKGADGVVISGCKAFTEDQKTLMLLQFAKTIDNVQGNKSKFMSGKDFVDVCKAGGIKTQAECYSRVFYPVLTKMEKVRIVDACKTKVAAGAQLHCIDTFADLNVTSPQAYGLIFKYTDKFNHYVMCHPIEFKTEMGGNAKTGAAFDTKSAYMPVMCTTIDNGHFYTFKFRGIDNTNDLIDTSVDNLKKGICRLWDSEYVGFGVGGCLTKCDNETLEEFGLKGRQIDADSTGNVFCEIVQESVSEDSLKTYPGHEEMSMVFKDVQAKHDNMLEDTIRNYAELIEGIKVSSFKCQYTPQLYEGWTYKDRALRCKINDIDVDFIFDDLSESSSFSRAAGAQGLQCVLAGGKFATGPDCRGITRARCESMVGTHWDSGAEVCILDVVEAKKTAESAAWLAGGLVLSVLFLPSGVAAIAISVGGSVGFDFAFAGIERLEMLSPAHRARDFANDVKACKIPNGTENCSVDQKNCANKVLRDNFARLNEILEDLNDDQMEVIGDLMENVTSCLDDGELQYTVQVSDTKITDKALASASMVLMVGSFVFSPEKFFAKLANLKQAAKITRVFQRAGLKPLSTVDDILNGVRYRKVALDDMVLDELNKLSKELKDRGFYYGLIKDENGKQFLGIASEDIFTGGIGDFLSRSETLRGLNSKGRLTFTTSSTLNGKQYMRISMGNNPNMQETQALVNKLQSEGFYVSSNSTISGEKFIGVSRENIFGPWNKSSNNWISNKAADAGKVADNAADVVKNTRFIEKFPDYTKHSNDGFYVSSNKFDHIFSDLEVKKLFDEGYYAKAVPTKGASKGEEYLIVAISKDDAVKAGLKWNGTDFVKPIDNSAFIRNLNNLKGKEITKIGETPVILESVGEHAKRGIAIVRVGDKRVPFYVSSGSAGKTEVMTGKWDAFFGIDETGWFRKGNLEDINDFYGSNELRKIANALDTKLGDPRTSEQVLATIGRNKSGGAGVVATCESNFGSISVEEVNKGLGRGQWALIARDIISYLEKIK